MSIIYEPMEYSENTERTYTVNGVVSTGILMSTLWNQSGAVQIGNNTTISYNEYCPLDKNKHSVTGCTNTAAAQIIYYFIEKRGFDLHLTLNSGDEYSNIKADGSTPGTISFSAVNDKLAYFDINSADDIAALNYACGVIQQATYGANATSTAWKADLFLRAGFCCAINTYASESNYWRVKNSDGTYSISDAGFEVIIENLAAGRVVGTSYPGHALVIDGYDSTTDKFHINYGWGKYASATNWYTRQEMNEIEYNHFMYDLMEEKITTLTVNDGDVYGTGTMVRAFEQAAAIQGDNIVNFADSVKNQSIHLKSRINLKESTVINDFNMSVWTESDIGFYIYGSTTEFNNFNGELVVNGSGNYNRGFYAHNNTTGIVLNTDGSLIYAGRYSINGDYAAGAAAIFDALRAYQTDRTVINNKIITKKYSAIHGTSHGDKIHLNNNTVVVGDIYMYGGDGTVSVANNSTVIGDISVGDGADTISVTNSSTVIGNINGGDGTDSLTIDSTSSVSGVYYYIENTSFVLKSNHNTQAMYYIKSNVYNVYSYAKSITADISAATAGEYVLFEADSQASYAYYLSELTITVTGGSILNDVTLSVSGNSHCDYADLIYRDNKLILNILGYNPGDTTPPSVPNGLTAKVSGSKVEISWNSSTDKDSGVYGYKIRYGSTSSLVGDGTAVSSTEIKLESLKNGTYYYQICAVDNSGNCSDWSAVQNFVIDYSDTPSKIMSAGLIVSSAATFTNKQLYSKTSMFVSKGGNALNTKVYSGAVQKVFSSGTASGTTVYDGGFLYVSKGGSAVGLNISNGGSGAILSSGFGSDIKVLSGGTLSAANSANISDVTVSRGGKIFLAAQAGINDITVSSGAIINKFMLSEQKYYNTLSGALNLSNVTLTESTSVSSGSVVKNIDMNHLAALTVYSGGSVSVKFNPWKGKVTSYTGANVEYLERDANVYYGVSSMGILLKGNTLENLNITDNRSAIVYSGGTLKNASIQEKGYTYISGGLAEKTSILSGGSMSVCAGTANSTTVYSGGSMSVLWGGTANSTTLKNGHFYISSGAAANDTVVSSGIVRIYNGGTADDTVVSSGAVYVSSGGTADDTVVASGTVHVLSGGTANDTIVSSGYMYVDNGGIATNAVVEYGGTMQMRSSATLSGSIIVSGKLQINKDVNAANADITIDLTKRTTSDTYCITNLDYLESANLTISVSDTQSAGKYQLASSAANWNSNIAFTVKNSSNNIIACSTLSVNGATQYNGKLYTLSKVSNTLYLNIENAADNTPEKPIVTATPAAGWTRNQVTVTAQFCPNAVKKEFSYDQKQWYTYVDSIALTENKTIYFRAANEYNFYGETAVFQVNNIDKIKPELSIVPSVTTWTNAGFTVNASANDTISGVKSVEWIWQNRSGKLGEWNTGSSFYAIDNGIICFRVTDNAGNSITKSYNINNIDKTAPVMQIAGNSAVPAKQVTLSVNVYDNASGVKLTQYSFDNQTWITGSSVTVTSNGTVWFKSVDNAGNVTVQSTVVDKINTSPASPDANLLSNGTSQIVAWDKEKGAVGFVATDGNEAPAWRGVWDWDGADVDLWRVVGIGHFAGSQVDHDGILLYNGIGTTFAAWTNLNSGDYGYVDLCHVEGNFNTKTLTDLDGNEYDDVLIYDEKGSFGVVLDGTSYQDIWHVEDAAANPWQLKGAGMFGGNEEKLIVQNASGHLYLWSNNDTAFSTWNWSQEAIGYLGNDWEFVTSGDFAGDGTDDIVVRKLSDGGLWVWDDGKESTARWVGTPGKGFKVEAVGDYNGDGKEDLLLREYTTGWGGVGYWASADASKWNDLNARIETNLESKFSVIA